ncbi:hypothetical protein VTI74DRAFT_2911 [Chaetomium olivicolor]
MPVLGFWGWVWEEAAWWFGRSTKKGRGAITQKRRQDVEFPSARERILSGEKKAASNTLLLRVFGGRLEDERRAGCRLQKRVPRASARVWRGARSCSCLREPAWQESRTKPRRFPFESWERLKGGKKVPLLRSSVLVVARGGNIHQVLGWSKRRSAVGPVAMTNVKGLYADAAGY